MKFKPRSDWDEEQSSESFKSSDQEIILLGVNSLSSSESSTSHSSFYYKYPEYVSAIYSMEEP